MADEYGYVSIEDSMRSVAVIALIVMVLSPILIFLGLLVSVLKGFFSLIGSAVKGAVNALIHI